MPSNSYLFPNFIYSEMKRGMKRKLFIVLAVVFVTVFFMVNFNGGTSWNTLLKELDDLRLNYTKLLSECEVYRRKQINESLPTIYAVTPTYTRPVQKAELTRLSHTFMLVPQLHWVVVEDAKSNSDLVRGLLQRSRIAHTLIAESTPAEWKLREKDPNWIKPRGVLQRNAALKWLRMNIKPNDGSVIYFADDDNVYSLEIFEEMRWTKKVSVWPVGLVGGMMVERPIIDPVTGKVSSWNAAWRPERPFPIDMAGFAVSGQLLLDRPEAVFSLTVQRGFQESHFLESLVTRDQLEPRASNCTKVYVWHTRTEAPKMTEEIALNRRGKQSNLGIEV